MAIPFPSQRFLVLRAVPVAWTGALADALVASGLVLAALFVRWPHLLDSPAFPAVGQTVLAALAVANAEAWPLADQAPYLGAPFVYLLAAVYRAFGASVETTMLLAWLVGGLTVVPVYLLGKELAGRTAGIMAGALLATSPAHAVITSHVPWVHSLTPLFGAVSLWLLARAVIRRDVRALMLSGLTIGLSLQTHPTALPLLIGAGSAALLWLRSTAGIRGTVMFACCIVLGYSPLLLHHAQTHFQVVTDVQGKRARYLDADSDVGERSDRGVYINNLEQLSTSLVRLTAGELLDDRASTGAYLGDPRLIIYPLLGVAGLALGRKRHGWLLLAGLVPAVLLPPLLNGKYKPILDGRYLMPLVPVIFVGIGLLVARVGRQASRSRLHALAAVLLMASTAALVLNPLSALGRFYEESAEDGASNQLYFRTLAAVREHRQGAEIVALDARLREVKMPGGASAGSTMAWLLPVSGIAVEEASWSGDSTALHGQLLILHRATADELRKRAELTYLDGFSANGKDQPSYRVVRLTSH